MTVAVVGAGAVGMTIGAAFAAAGHQVLACGRRVPEDDAIRVDDGADERRLPVRWLTGPGQVASRADWIILATKLHQTEGARPWLDALVGNGTRIIAAQNGVDHRDRLRRITPAPVAPALVYYNAERLEPGRVRVRPTERDLVFPDDETGAEAARTARDAGIRAVTDPDFATAAWVKLLTNAAANPITALTGRRIEVLREPDVVPFALRVLEETAEVGRAEGARLPADAARERLAWLQNLQAGSTTSMLQDREAGAETEHDGLTGAVVRLAAAHGIDVPASAALLDLLSRDDVPLVDESWFAERPGVRRGTRAGADEQQR
ncbi:MAG: 2-dehydropantoate 2-reductase [Streptosporangiales bacterium]|nr:2-dehydropantoate 2-reductase [Streptosporangiales bacterium]